VLYPTETMYGLGGRAEDASACARVNRLKGSPEKPQIVLVDSIPEWMSGSARQLAEAFWPGPLTLVVDAPPAFATGAWNVDGSIALRWSPHPVVGALVHAVGPITSTSANRHGHPPICSPRELTFSVDAVVDAGHLPLSEPSTMVDARSGQILRDGVRVEEIRVALADLVAMA